MRSNHGEMGKSCLKRQVKMINTMDNDCPRLNNNNNNSCLIVRSTRRRFFKWGPGRMTIIPRISKKSKRSKQKPRLSGFFQAQLRMMKMKSLKHNKGKLSFNKSVDHQIISNSAKSLVSKKLKISCLQLRNVEKTKTSLINYQFGTSSGSGSGFPILKRHRNMFDNELTRNRLRIHDLPKELLAEILVRLPVKDILRCRSVQKSWNYFIISPVFISLHLNYQKQVITGNHNYCYPKYLCFEDEDSFDLTVRFDDVQCEEYCKLEFLPGLPIDDAWFALSYGLICMSTLLLSGRNHNRNIFLWNPLIKKYKTLPESPLPSTKNWQGWEALAFGFIPEVDDYVVIHIIKPCLPPHPDSVIIGVYSLKTNSWKKSSQDNVFISRISSDDDNVVFINGVAFWLGVNSDKLRILMCFDTKTNILCEISLPDWVASQPLVPIIHQFGQSIAYFVWEEGVNHFDMWVLKYDHINEFTWEKKMCVSPSKDVQEEVLGIRNNGDPILAKSNNLISYSLDSHQENGFVDSWNRWTPDSPDEEGYGPPYVIRPFVESLVMLNDQ